MRTRSRLIVGSLAGAVAIHLAMLACSGSEGTTVGMDAGQTDAAGPDARADRPAVDTGSRDTGPLDALLDVVRDAMGVLVDAEVRDAHAGGDAGTGTCACPPPPDYSFSLRMTRAGMAQTVDPEYSTATVTVTPARGPGEEPRPRVVVNAVATFQVRTTDSDAGVWTTYILTCTANLRTDRSLVPGTLPRCIFESLGLGSSSVQGSDLDVTTLTDTQIEFRIPGTLQFMSPAGLSGALTDITFRANVPTAHFVTPPRTFRTPTGM